MSEGKWEIFGCPGYHVEQQAGQLVLTRKDGTTVYSPQPGTPEQVIAQIAKADDTCERMWREEQYALALDDLGQFLTLQAARIVAQDQLRRTMRGGAIGAAFVQGPGGRAR